jgi:hypothetical protein
VAAVHQLRHPGQQALVGRRAGGTQVRSLFPRDQVLLLRYRDLVDHPVPTADQVCRFLGVDTGAVTEVPRRNVRPDVSGREDKPDRAERLGLLPRFIDDIRRIEALTGWDLAQWRADEPAGW